MFLYKLLLTLNATSWMAIIYAIKEGWTIGKIPSHFFGIMLLIIPVFLSWLSLALSRFLGTESPVLNCKEFNLADGEFLPIYLGYFFVSVGVSEHFTMLVVYLIVFVFTFLSQTQYYNPIYLLFGYVDKAQVEKYLKPLADDLLLGVVEEESVNIRVRDEDKKFIAKIYSYCFVGIMLDWIKDDMKEKPEDLVERLALVLDGDIGSALKRFNLSKPQK